MQKKDSRKVFTEGAIKNIYKINGKRRQRIDSKQITISENGSSIINLEVIIGDGPQVFTGET